MRRAAALAGIAIALLLPAGAAAAECPRTTLGDVEDEVMCPVCGTPLALATEAPQAQRQREFIERQIARCASKDDIKRALVAQFGEQVLALPGDEEDGGIEDTLVYVVPALALLAALAGIAFAALRWRGRRGPPRPESAASGGRAREAELDADMRRYDL